MGQKVHPIGIRLNVIRRHNANWYAAPKDYADYVIKDVEARAYVYKQLKAASVSKVFIERSTGSAKITISSARPGVIIGKKGEDIEALQKQLTKILGVTAQVNIHEITRPDLDARLVAEGIATQIEKRIMFRRAMKRAVQNSMRSGAKGIKVELSGRLGGAEIARTEWYREGRVPLHTLRADVDYSTFRAETTYGTIGIKVWVFRGEILDGMASAYNTSNADAGKKGGRPGGRNERNDAPGARKPRPPRKTDGQEG